MHSLSRDELAAEYFELLPFTPYPIQEEALLAWFTSEQGVLVCAPTGTGKTLIAEAAVYEALRTGQRLYYTTPLIALTDQKLQELSDAAERWGFSRDQVGLVTGNRRVNPQAPVLVVVAEILLNRLLHPAAFDFRDVFAVVMDEFHSFNDPERGIVWEFSLGLLPPSVRLLLLSATVGNSLEFVNWLEHSHQRRLQLVEGHERKVPLTYHWVGDALLSEQIEAMAEGDEATQLIPALIFCFNREECWTVAEQLKGKKLIRPQQQAELVKRLEQFDWSKGAGPKLKQLLMRGVGVHHAGVLPKYRRIVEELYQQKLLSVTVCTETLSAGINLPARSVVLPTLLKGPHGDKRLLDPSSAHQMFGRAGRPQYDTRGHVFALAHEDDVKLLRWKEKYDQIPEDTRDPGLLRAKKAMEKKKPKRRTTEQYWEESHFQKLITAAPRKLVSRGRVPWRLLAHMLEASPEVELLRRLVSKRLLEGRALETQLKELDRMLMALWRGGYVQLEPEPPKPGAERDRSADEAAVGGEPPPPYRPERAYPTERLPLLATLRGVNPLYGLFLVNHLGIADYNERLQAFESVLELPRSILPSVRVPHYDEMPAGPLAVTRLDPHLLQLGLATAEELGAVSEEEEDEDPRRRMFAEERPRVLMLADKLRLLFEYDYPEVHDVKTQACWAAGELLEYGGEFNKYITSKGLQKQEGILFRHLLRLILLCSEFRPLVPPDADPDEWHDSMTDLIERLAETCREVDPESTDKALQEAEQLEEAIE